MRELYNNNEISADKAEKSYHELDVYREHTAYFVVKLSLFHVT